MKYKITSVFLVGFLLTGCATTGDFEPTDSMDQTVVDIKPAGPLLTSNEIDKMMGQSDKDQLQQLVNTATPQQKVSWKNDAKNNQFEFNSIKVYVDNAGLPCRKYSVNAVHSAFLSHREENRTSNACRMDDGVWRLK